MKVVVSGFYGFGNTGDEAIGLAITRELKKHGHTPLLLSQTPAETAALYGCESAPRMNPLGLARAIMGADVLLSGGGGLLQDKTSRRNLTYYLGIIRLAKLLGKRVKVFNQSIGPLSDAGKKQVAAGLRGVPAVVRDQASLELLRNLGVQAELGGDPALLLEPSGTVQRDPNTVVIAPRGDVESALPALRELVTGLRQQGRRVVALSFYPHEDDQAAHSLGADEVVSTTDPQVALNTIAGSSFVVGVRLHAVILAAAAGVPFAGIAYDPKVSGFCRDAGAPFHSVTPDVAGLLGQVAGQVSPDWDAVAQMKARAAQSFTALG